MAKWIQVGTEQEFTAGEKTCLTVENQQVCVMNIDGDLHAIVNICPHAGLPLGEGDLAEKVLTCPFHGFSFNVETGKNIDYEDDVPLMKLPVRTVDGKVEVDVES